MSSSLQTRLKRASRLLPVALLPFAAHAQFNYAPSNATNVAGTYTDLGTTGTAITTANTDDANSTAQAIGFSFSFNGATFTQFVLNTNGLIRLGSAAPSSAAAFPTYAQAPETGPISGTNTADVNLIAPLNLDLGPGTAGGTEYRVVTTGTAPNRVCTIQWKNVSDKPQAAAASVPTVITSQLANVSFQVKLYETTNNIEFVYGAAVVGTGTANAKYAAVGIKGSAPASSVVASKLSSAAWSTTTFAAGPYLDPTLGNGHNIRQTFLPDAGRTYRFVPGASCGDITVSNVSTTNNSIVLTFTPGSGNTSYNVTYTAGGAVQTLTPAPTASPVTIPNLLPGTTYQVTIQGVCSAGAGATLGGLLTTTGTPPAATYVTLPYTESFEGPWVNGLSTRDLPTVNWRNMPATTDASWRREDDGASANWSFLTGAATGAYTPVASAGSHSARFHTYGTDAPADGGLLGKLDLYANLSGTGTKTLTFDYINPTGTDQLQVFLSTDGGATFSTTALVTAGVSASFSSRTVTIPSTSATSVIRFQATSDFGNDDIGIDNLRLTVISATRNEALAATVGLAPNPAHSSFQLLVPAGSLHAATATLSNALGQTVLVRQLNLPAAGGTADFDVSRLAAGVYSLTLKTGNDLVVKRVVVE
ncbi:T9SS type A sorting domain-containing protein [Hymenobacter sp. M29]|uniref:T9SS type A sorting domain-containing protein n=1 Tax=Hymenobacter mellowenesis TaxID=3063995 RepID=A0ABT9AEX7_9BACT|nr:T9SS type A sorting domain-containing protein [Hymenobacter sp. M29]MDO7848395.1 T9SS type A sorting domain-containing protein [Hymenobacter sp. M29]